MRRERIAIPATRATRALLAALALTAVGAPQASAHVDVLPREAPPGEAREFVVRVPTEREIPTVRVEVLFPPQVTVFAFAPSPGWTRRELTARDGNLRGVVYSGGRIPPGEYQDFRFLATPFEEGTAIWRSRQTYADGAVKPWTGPPESGAGSGESGPTVPGPAAATSISRRFAAGSAAPATAAPEGDGSSSAGIWLGVVAIAIAAASALGVGLLWSTRPARLPPDEEEGGATTGGADRSA
jgi:uncharacterized protein YcnI